jgi:hypothetical protein
MSIEAMKQALEALERADKISGYANNKKAITALRQAIAEEALNKKAENARELGLTYEQEPVAMRYDFDGYGYKYIDSGSGSDWQTRIKDAEPLYTHPPKRKPLTDEQIDGVWTNGYKDFARAIEAAHGIKGKS